ncbi:MAG: hypothetical protein Q4F97_12735 [Bacteroidales bacterium]|nr:hypothetical protein [Bacteroidales bacterium]
MKKIISILLFFLSFVGVTNANKLESMYFTCPDFIYYEGVLYSGNSSFLSAYEKYKDLFKEEGRPRYTNKQPYVLLWIIEDDKLYVCGLDYYHIQESVSKSLKEIESLTNHKMPLAKLKHNDFSNIPNYMKFNKSSYYYANMVSGTFYIKKDMGKSENMLDWMKGSFLELKIKNGSIKSKCDWENMLEPVRSKSSEHK